MAEWAHYSEPDPEWTASLAKSPLAWRNQDTGAPVDIEALRAQSSQAAKLRLQGLDYPKTGLTVTDATISVDSGRPGEIEARIYMPDGDADETYPVLVDFHGGGYVLGNLDSDDPKCRSACVNNRVVAVNVNYRHAPEFPWPTGVNDSYTAVKWVKDHAREFRGDVAKGFILIGSSAGAGFASIIAQRARNDPELSGKLTGQILQIPPTLGFIGPGDKVPEKFVPHLLSGQQNKNDPVLNAAARKIFIDAYKPGPLGHPDCSPLLAESLEGLPPAYFQVAGGDVLRDEGLLYEKLLRESGVPTKLNVYPGVPHGFSNLRPDLKISQKYRDDTNEGLKWLLALQK